MKMDVSFFEYVLDRSEVENVPRARIIICGLGQMGQRGFLSVVSLINHLRAQENVIAVDIVGIVEPGKEPMRATMQMCMPLSIKPVYGTSLESVIDRLSAAGVGVAGTIIYDASPTSEH